MNVYLKFFRLALFEVFNNCDWQSFHNYLLLSIIHLIWICLYNVFLLFFCLFCILNVQRTRFFFFFIVIVAVSSFFIDGFVDANLQCWGSFICIIILLILQTYLLISLHYEVPAVTSSLPQLPPPSSAAAGTLAECSRTLASVAL